MLGVDEPGGLLTVHLFGEMSMEEGVADVHLVHWPSSGSHEVQNSPNRARFDNRSKRIREVDVGALTEASDHPARLLALDCTIGAQLVLEHPLASDDVGARRAWNELPSLVPLQSIKLFLHSCTPLQIA
jgi:hypothetical protein